MDSREQDMGRLKQPAMAVAGGIAAALVVATLPHVYLENIIGATGLSEIIPAAAPPLGNTARGLIAVATGMISTSALYLFLNHNPKFPRGGSDMSSAIRRNLKTDTMDNEREGKSRFAIPKLDLSAKSLTKFLKKPKKAAGQVTELQDLPDIKPADRHPDAPARHPIFASSDLGVPLTEKIKQFDESEADEEFQEPVEQSVAPVERPAPSVADSMLHSPTEEETTPIRSETNIDHEQPAAPREDLNALSIAQLADRLEAGLRRLEALERRGQIAPSPAAAGSAPIAENMVGPADVCDTTAPAVVPPLRSVESVETDAHNDRQADMDTALKAALGTLERMTVQR